MQTLQERMTKDFTTKMKDLQRKHEQEKQQLQKELDKERRSIKEQRKLIEKDVSAIHSNALIRIIYIHSYFHLFFPHLSSLSLTCLRASSSLPTSLALPSPPPFLQVQKQLMQSYQTEQKKVTQEMSMMTKQIKDMEERFRDSQDADRTKAEVIREMQAQHQAELESYSRSSKLSSRQQVSTKYSSVIEYSLYM